MFGKGWLDDYPINFYRNGVDGTDPILQELGGLHNDGLTEVLLRYAWDKYPDDAGTIRLPEVAEKPEGQRQDPSDTTAPLALDDEDFSILSELNQEPPRLLTTYDLEQACLVTRKTVGRRLHRLIERGLAIRPQGDRAGATITDLGKNLLTPAVTKNTP